MEALSWRVENGGKKIRVENSSPYYLTLLDIKVMDGNGAVAGSLSRIKCCRRFLARIGLWMAARVWWVRCVIRW